MEDTLVDPHTIPDLSEIDFEGLECTVGTLRNSSGSLERRGERVDARWWAGISAQYLAPAGSNLAEKMFPVKQSASTIVEACGTTADALHGYVRTGQPIKKALRQLKRDAEDLVTRARALGEEWHRKPELVEENDRIKRDVGNRVRDLEAAEQEAADKIHSTNDGPGVNTADKLGRYGIGNAGYVTMPVFGFADWATKAKWGTFKPQGYMANGRWGYLPWRHESPWTNARRAVNGKNWAARAGGKPLRTFWSKFGTWSFRFGSAAAGVTAGLGQYGQDSQYKHMPEWKRDTRASVKGAATTAGFYYGADWGMTGGMYAGMAIGTALGGPVVGTVIGGVVGGIVGSGVGSKLAGWAADGVNSLIGKD